MNPQKPYTLFGASAISCQSDRKRTLWRYQSLMIFGMTSDCKKMPDEDVLTRAFDRVQEICKNKYF
jgi:hypothetical protein